MKVQSQEPRYILSLFILLISMCANAQMTTQPRLTNLHGSVSDAALNAMDAGPVEGSTDLPGLSLYVARTPAQNAALKNLLSDQQTPGNRNYHRWLSPEQFGAKFGISSADEATLRTWLAAQGFQNVTLSTSRTAFRFTGNAATASMAFHTSIHHVTREGMNHFANVTEVSLPETIAPLVHHVGGLNNFRLRAMNVRTSQVTRPQFTSGSYFLLAPGDIAVEYNLKPLFASGIDGTGITVVIIGQSEIDLSNVDDYRSGFNLPPSTPSQILANSDPTTTELDQFEAYGDLEVAGAAAPGAKLVYVHDADVETALEYAIDKKLGSIISSSYGGGEGKSLAGITTFVTGWQMLAQQANAEGITILNASGDTGAAGGDQQDLASGATAGEFPDFPADIPEVTGVGGTEFKWPSFLSYFGSTNDQYGGSLVSPIPELAWNPVEIMPNGSVTNFLASGGGVSQIFPKPVWQRGGGVPDDGHRDVPDVALFSSANGLGYGICASSDCANGSPNNQGNGALFGGTSASAPVFAGIVALVNQYLLNRGVISTPGLGNINPNLYRLAANTTDVFHDITSGDNILPCQVGSPDCPFASGPFASSGYGSFGYTAGPGYDLVTGLGSVDGYNLATEWSAQMQTGTSISISANQPILNGNNLNLIVTAKVSAIGTNKGVPDGSVSLYSLSSEDQNYPATLVGTALVDSTGVATFKVNSLDGRVYELSAEYSGSWIFGQSLASPLAVLSASVTTLNASSTSIAFGTPVTLTATVTGVANPGTGTVSFYNGTTLLGVLVLTGKGSVSLSVSNLPVGKDLITASYSGTTFLAASTSGPVTIMVAQPDFTITATPSSITATGGSIATSTLNIVPQNGFAESPTLSCSGLPAGSTCSFGTPVAQANGSTNVSLSIATVALVGDARGVGNYRDGYVVALAPLFLLLSGRKRRKFLRRIAMTSGLALVLFAAGLVGCGGGGAASSGSPKTPQSQTSTVTVTALSKGGITHAVNVTLTVN